MRANALVLTFVAWASASCGASQNTKEHRPTADAPKYTLHVWIDADARLPRQAIMDGCAKWKAERITCVEAGSSAFADIRIYANDDACAVTDPRDPTDKTVHTYLAWAFQGGDIKMMMGCMPHDKDSVYDPKYFSGVVTHEIGHQIGIWDHVPADCKDEDVKTHAGDGRKICGPAVMNAYYSKDIDYVTEIDAMAFDERNVKYSVLVGDMPKKSTPDCTYELPAH